MKTKYKGMTFLHGAACAHDRKARWDIFTEKGEALIRASAAGKVRRHTAENALIGFLARVEQYNSDPNKLLTVEVVVVFGSFLGGNDKLGDWILHSSMNSATRMTPIRPLLRLPR